MILKEGGVGIGGDGLEPSYDGTNLVNLVAELEIRLSGRSPSPGLRPGLADLVPDAWNYLLLIIDGLGDQQLAHPSAAVLRRARRAGLVAPFPTTTTVGLSSVATALPPMQHGVIGYTQWIATLGRVVNMMMWADMSWGRRIDLDPVGFHPAPNLWQRLNTAGVRTVVYQPHAVLDTPLSNMLYRGAERYGYSSVSEVHPSLLFDPGGRTLAVVYTSRVDSAAHLSGQRSQSYSRALAETGSIWERFASTLPSDTALVGSADHGHCDIHPDGKIYLDRDLTDGMRCWGDGRVLMFLGPLRRVRRIARLTGAKLVDNKQLQQWLGQGLPHPALPELPNAALLAPEGIVILPHYMPSHQVGHHGGITPQELLIPLLVAETPAPH